MADTTSLQWLIDAVDKMRQNRTMQNPALGGQPQSMQNYLGDIGTRNAIRAPQQPAYNPAIPIAPRNFNTAGANVNPAATNTVANYPSSTPIPIRSTIEGIYGKGSVNYDPATGTIYLFDRRTGRTGTIPVGTYSLQNDTAYINPDYIRSWLNPQTVAPQERLNTEPPYQPYLEASSPGFRNMVNLVKAWQEANPVYVPFPAGTPTLERQKFDEARRQFDLGYELDLRRQAETERHNRVSESLSGGTGGKMSATEAKAFNKGAAMQIIKNKIDEAWKRGGWAAAVEALPAIQDWFMGTYYPELIRGGLDNNDIQDILVYARSLIGGDLSNIPFPKLSDKNTGGSGAPVSIAPNTANPQ